MLRFGKIRPIHGWRAFWGEVGIVVLGVLIALGAQQVVETISWNAKVRDFRAAADRELGENLTIYQFRLKQNGCVERRLAELQRLLDAGDGPPPRRIAPIREIDNYTQGLGVWDNKDDAVTAHLPGDLRNRYALIYEEFRNDGGNVTRENEVWRQIAQFNLPEPLTHADRLRLTELIARARRMHDNRVFNYHSTVVGLAEGLGITPRKPPFEFEADQGFCKPFLAPEA